MGVAELANEICCMAKIDIRYCHTRCRLCMLGRLSCLSLYVFV